METDVESFTESLTQSQFFEQRFLDDVDYDDASLEDMLYNAHRENVYHSQREGLSVGQSSSVEAVCRLPHTRLLLLGLGQASLTLQAIAT